MQLTVTEYNTWYTKILKKFAVKQTDLWAEQTYKMRKGYSPVKGKLLFLFCYALSTWEHDNSAINYLTEDQVTDIIAKSNNI